MPQQCNKCIWIYFADWNLSYKTLSPWNVTFCAITIHCVGPNALQQSNIYIALLIKILRMLCDNLCKYSAYWWTYFVWSYMLLLTPSHIIGKWKISVIEIVTLCHAELKMYALSCCSNNKVWDLKCTEPMKYVK